MSRCLLLVIAALASHCARAAVLLPVLTEAPPDPENWMRLTVENFDLWGGTMVGAVHYEEEFGGNPDTDFVWKPLVDGSADFWFTGWNDLVSVSTPVPGHEVVGQTNPGPSGTIFQWNSVGPPRSTLIQSDHLTYRFLDYAPLVPTGSPDPTIKAWTIASEWTDGNVTYMVVGPYRYRLASEVPEPASALLALCGLALLRQRHCVSLRYSQIVSAATCSRPTMSAMVRM